MNIEQIYQKWDTELEKKYHSLFPNAQSTIWDGVINPTLYYEAPLKIMFINKESPDNDNYKLNYTIREQIAKGISIFNGYGNFRNAIKLETILLNLLSKDNKWELTNEQVVEELNNCDDSIFYKHFEKCAICNIKKSEGKNLSQTEDLNTYLEVGKTIIEEQMSFFNPSIIVGGNVCDGLLENYFEWEENLYVEERDFKIYQIKIRNKTIPYFDLRHPSAFGKYRIDIDYCCRIWNAIKRIEKETPNYLDNFLNQKCFF